MLLLTNRKLKYIVTKLSYKIRVSVQLNEMSANIWIIAICSNIDVGK